MIAHWFTREDTAAFRPDRISRNSIWHQIKFLHDEELPYAAGDLLIISFDRKMSVNIKKNLYQFSATPHNALTIVDCGLFSQKNPEALLPVLREIRESGAMILLIGPPVGFMRFQVEAVEMVSIIRESNLDDDIHLRNLAPGPLFQYIGTQRHLVSESHLRVEGHLRLSDLKDDLSLAEPCIRDSGVMMFNCDSMSAAEVGHMTGMSGSGLSVIEACQLFRYAGAAQNLYSIGIYGYVPETDKSGMMSNALAQMIWYLLEGSMLREDPEKSHLTQYFVQAKDHEQVIHFYKSEMSGRWWLVSKSGRKIPCSYKDYRRACEEDYSDLIMKSVME
jgi:hypothetical protein